jgi:hypothetical protein
MKIATGVAQSGKTRYFCDCHQLKNKRLKVWAHIRLIQGRADTNDRTSWSNEDIR